MKEYLVVIFYIQGESQGSEITLAIEGWRQHFKEKHRIVVVGDEPPVEGVEWLPMKRVQEREGQYLPALDICNKLESVCTMYGRSYPYFIWASDDFFAVNDFTIDDVLVPKYYDEQIPRKCDKTCNHWHRTQVKTRKLCEKEGYGVINWVTHLPMWFNAGLLYGLIQDYNLTEEGYIVENIYYNKYKPDGELVKLSRRDRWQFMSCFTPLDRESMEYALANQIWVCCSVNGWCRELEEELQRHYGI